MNDAARNRPQDRPENSPQVRTPSQGQTAASFTAGTLPRARPSNPSRSRPPLPGQAPIRLGVSACLLGQPVRFDGGHKHDRWITGELGRHVEFVPVCPETEAGFGVPREAMRLVGDPDAPRLLTVRTGRDMTQAMTDWAERRVQELASEGLSGFIFKSMSPSSGMARVKVYSEKGGMPAHKGVGLFARAFMRRFPLLPVEEEGRLNDARLRENFIERLFVLRSWREAMDDCARREAQIGMSVSDARQANGDALPGAPCAGPAATLVDFHARHKLTLMAHSPEHLRRMGRLVAQAASLDPFALRQDYETLLVDCLGKIATVGRNANVLEHMSGYFRTRITADERQELAEVISDYRRGLTPLIVPVTLLKHHVRVQGQPYLAGQSFLNPHPLELKLRNSY